ncbi:GNAT family N-acetyltransferase [Chitinophaga rhizophila]|uniref:GNAT family N-acetyltransferase n=1 Tax=Chitinophaga rhizophila TaxID=2866212 RepID=A0ABS7GAN8_9BACT|nr:GNAT family N-acetyltransferase [Chitinophaga rhizophila]MBW8684732.1 GNAT family N-acetyltransferase [Chitinophaga rhizophila]
MSQRVFTPFPTLRTQRLTLRQLKLNDEKQVFSLRSDSAINKYLDRQIAETIDDATHFINKVNENVTRNNALYWAIVFSGDDVLIGTICLFNFSQEKDRCEIGYELVTAYQGKGIMAEAMEEVVNYAFNTLKLHTIEALSHRDNLPSKNLLAKFQFRDVNQPDKFDTALVCYHLTKPDTIQSLH